MSRMSDRLTGAAAPANYCGRDRAPALFAYGTLMLDPVLTILIGRVPSWSLRIAHDWRAASLPGRSYPGLVRAPGSLVTGREYHDLSHQEWIIIDKFEDSEYMLAEIIRRREGSVFSYVWPGAVEPTDWSISSFREHKMETYLAQCTKWRTENT